MNKFLVVVFSALLFGIIGSIFGPGGTLVGLLIGLYLGANYTEEHGLIGGALLSGKERNNFEEGKKNVQKAKEIAAESEYADLVTRILAGCIVADALIENKEVQMASDFISSDEIIKNKEKALERLSQYIDEYMKERTKSKPLWDLKLTTLTHKLKGISSDLERDRIGVIVGGMLEAIEDGNKAETEVFIEKIYLSLGRDFNGMSKKEVVEKYILNSGNKAAIDVLNEAKDNQGRYMEKIKEASGGNQVLRTALGVFTGVIAANLITEAGRYNELKNALEEFDQSLDEMGGLERLDINENGYMEQKGICVSALEDIVDGEEKTINIEDEKTFISSDATGSMDDEIEV